MFYQSSFLAAIIMNVCLVLSIKTQEDQYKPFSVSLSSGLSRITDMMRCCAFADSRFGILYSTALIRLIVSSRSELSNGGPPTSIVYRTEPSENMSVARPWPEPLATSLQSQFIFHPAKIAMLLVLDFNQLLTLSLPIQLRLYTLPYWSNPLFLMFDIWALWRSRLSARAPKCQKLEMWVRPVWCWTLQTAAIWNSSW